MGTVIMIAQFLLALTILVTVHELGHFLAAKFFKIRVDKFYIFFDFLFPMSNVGNYALFKKQIGETEYGIGYFPMGGYVAINGMVDETTSSDQLASEPQPYEYRSKPHWQKIIVILGGIIFNIILGILIYAMWLSVFQKDYLPVSEMKSGIYVHEAGAKLGFKQGDKIVAVNGTAPVRYDDCFPMEIFFGGNYTVERTENGATTNVTIDIPKDFHKQIRNKFFEPYYHQVKIMGVGDSSNALAAGVKPDDIITSLNGINYNNFGEFKAILDSNKSKLVTLDIKRNNEVVKINCKVDTAGKLGIMPLFTPNKSKYTTKEYSILESFKYGTSECFKNFMLQGAAIFKMGKGELSVKENLGGMITMAKIFGNEWVWSKFWLLTALISIGLAFMNLLPIPGLDGGHFVIIMYEWITGKPVSMKVMDTLQSVGTFLILSLMVFAMWNDIMRWFPTVNQFVSKFF
jgi:regulator of sigma E protease